MSFLNDIGVKDFDATAAEAQKSAEEAKIEAKAMPLEQKAADDDSDGEIDDNDIGRLEVLNKIKRYCNNGRFCKYLKSMGYKEGKMMRLEGYNEGKLLDELDNIKYLISSRNNGNSVIHQSYFAGVGLIESTVPSMRGLTQMCHNEANLDTLEELAIEYPMFNLTDPKKKLAFNTVTNMYQCHVINKHLAAKAAAQGATAATVPKPTPTAPTADSDSIIIDSATANLLV